MHAERSLCDCIAACVALLSAVRRKEKRYYTSPGRHRATSAIFYLILEYRLQRVGPKCRSVNNQARAAHSCCWRRHITPANLLRMSWCDRDCSRILLDIFSQLIPDVQSHLHCSPHETTSRLHKISAAAKKL